jgi:hypothetical protein
VLRKGRGRVAPLARARVAADALARPSPHGSPFTTAFATRRQLIPQLLSGPGRVAALPVALNIDGGSTGIHFQDGEFTIPRTGIYQVHYSASVYNTNSRNSLHAGLEWRRRRADEAQGSYVDWTEVAVDVPALNTMRLANLDFLHFQENDRLSLHYWAETPEVHLSSNCGPSDVMHSLASVSLHLITADCSPSA